MDYPCEQFCFYSKGWITRNLEYKDMSPAYLYANALNLMTETISKVGYGMSNAPLNTLEMLFIMSIIIFNFNDLTALFLRSRQTKLRMFKDYLKEEMAEVETYVSHLEGKVRDCLPDRSMFDLI